MRLAGHYSQLDPKKERIAKVIARSGLCSRRDAEALIAAGRVSVNGETIASAALDVSEADRIAVDGKELPSREPARLWRYHKPKGRVTTHKDPQGRPTVFEALPKELPRLISVGRLDFNTEGLLLLTNDGDLARHMELPSTGWTRRYRVRAHGHTDQAALGALKEGVTIDGVRFGPIDAELEREQGKNVWLTLAIREGKNREVRRIMEHLGLTVNRLIRISFGPFMLGDLEPGQIEEVGPKVLREQLGTRLSRQFGVMRAPLSESMRSKPARLRRKAPQAAASPSPREEEDRSPYAPKPRRRRILAMDGGEPAREELVPAKRARSFSGGKKPGGDTPSRDRRPQRSGHKDEEGGRARKTAARAPLDQPPFKNRQFKADRLIDNKDGAGRRPERGTAKAAGKSFRDRDRGESTTGRKGPPTGGKVGKDRPRRDGERRAPPLRPGREPRR